MFYQKQKTIQSANSRKKNQSEDANEMKLAPGFF